MSEQEQAHEVVRQQFAQWLIAVDGWRHIEVPAAGAPPEDIREALLAVRARLDQMEEVLSLAIGLKGGILRQARECAAQAEDEWDAQARRIRQAGRLDSYAGSRALAAECNLETLGLRRTARALQQLQDHAAESVDRMWLRYRGLKDVRAELLDRARTLVFESSLDR